MHHAKDQIGLEAFDDRMQKNTRSRILPKMNAWIKSRRRTPPGTGVIDTYVWDDPGLSRVQRVVAFQSIYIQGERRIVNSTIPVQELSRPADCMMTMLTGTQYFVYPAPGCSYGHSVKKPFSGGNSAEGKSRLFKRDQSGHGDLWHRKTMKSGITADPVPRHDGRHIAHEFNNYMTPVLIYAELLENDDSISAENQEMIHEITGSSG